MKKITILTVALALVLSGCGSEIPAENRTEEPTQSTEAVQTAPAAEETTLPTFLITEETTVPPETEPAATETESRGETGTVIARSLNVRESPSISGFKVGTLQYGDRVTIFETKPVNGMIWGHIDSGWISMDYVQIGKNPISQQNQKTELPTEPTQAPEQEIVPPVPTEPVFQEEPTETIPQPAETQPPSEQPLPQNPPEESAPTEPVPCLHQWTVIENIPAEYTYEHYVVCSCGERFSDAAAWKTHSESFSGEALLNHTGYASGSDKTEVSPPMVSWKCDLCGSTKTISAWDNP